MDATLPDHDHCRFCGDPVPFDQAYCSEECYYADQKRIRSERLRDVLIGVIAVAGALAVLAIGFIF